jgi:hypothetical protein
MEALFADLKANMKANANANVTKKGKNEGFYNPRDNVIVDNKIYIPKCQQNDDMQRVSIQQFKSAPKPRGLA